MRRLTPLTAAAAAFVGSACAAGAPMRQTTADNARNDDPFLHGTPCPQQEGSSDASALRIDDLVVGTGAPVAEGETVRVHYEASLLGGATLRNSRDDGPPIEVIVGSSKTICGFARSLPGMRAGGQRRVVVPWALAFGEEGREPGVPPRTDLVFVIDLFRPAETPSGQGGPPPRPGAATRRR